MYAKIDCSSVVAPDRIPTVEDTHQANKVLELLSSLEKDILFVRNHISKHGWSSATAESLERLMHLQSRQPELVAGLLALPGKPRLDNLD